jgi:hypothetical protein
MDNTAPRLFLFVVAFLETLEPWRSPHRLKVLSDSSTQKIAAEKIATAERSFDASGVGL